MIREEPLAAPDIPHGGANLSALVLSARGGFHLFRPCSSDRFPLPPVAAEEGGPCKTFLVSPTNSGGFCGRLPPAAAVKKDSVLGRQQTFKVVERNSAYILGPAKLCIGRLRCKVDLKRHGEAQTSKLWQDNLRPVSSCDPVFVAADIY